MRSNTRPLFALNFDFVPTNGNLERMIREAEIQSADVVAASFVNENGHWKNSCFQFNIRPWELTVKNGYHKSLRGAMYCDGSFGPLLLSIWILIFYLTLTLTGFEKFKWCQVFLKICNYDFCYNQVLINLIEKNELNCHLKNQLKLINKRFRLRFLYAVLEKWIFKCLWRLHFSKMNHNYDQTKNWL